jgi:hypothetical protein
MATATHAAIQALHKQVKASKATEVVHAADVVLGRAAFRQARILAVHALGARRARVRGTKVVKEVIAVVVSQEQALKHLHGLAVQRCGVLELCHHELHKWQDTWTKRRTVKHPKWASKCEAAATQRTSIVFFMNSKIVSAHSSVVVEDSAVSRVFGSSDLTNFSCAKAKQGCEWQVRARGKGDRPSSYPLFLRHCASKERFNAGATSHKRRNICHNVGTLRDIRCGAVGVRAKLRQPHQNTRWHTQGKMTHNDQQTSAMRAVVLGTTSS